MNMKRTSLLTVLAAFAIVTILSQDAMARNRMYNPAAGRFMQRDPAGTMMVAPPPPMARNLSGSMYTQRDPTQQYADGLNLYQYVRSGPVRSRDPYGLREQLACGGKNLTVDSFYCCKDERTMILKAVCSAYKTLQAVENAFSVQLSAKPMPGQSMMALRFDAYFNALAILGDDRARGRMEKVKSKTREINAGISNASVSYTCDGRTGIIGGWGGCAGNPTAWTRPYGGITVHLCTKFFYEPGMDDRLRTLTVIHELSHLSLKTTDYLSWGPSGGADTYVDEEDDKGAPVYSNVDNLPGRAYGDEGHADTLAWFMMGWYTP